MERHKDELFKNVRNNEVNTKLSGPNRLSLISQYGIYHIAKKKVSLAKPTRETPIGPSCRLGKPIRSQDSLYYARSRISPYNKELSWLRNVDDLLVNQTASALTCRIIKFS